MQHIKKPILFRLHIVIAGLFISLIVGFGSFLGWYNYSETSELLFDASNEVFNQISQELSLDYQGTYKPVATAVTIISNTEIVRAGNLEERLLFLPMLQAALREAPHLSGLEVGYENGDFFIARPLIKDFMRTRFDAPKTATLVVDHVATGKDGKRYLDRLWLNDNLEVVRRRPTEETEYDPRVRPWYMMAIKEDRLVGTDPYLFHFIRQVGFTIAYKSPLAEAVIAGDVTLMQLSEILASHRVTERSELVLLSEEELVVAYQDAAKLKTTSDTDGLRLARIDDLSSKVLAHAVGTIGFEDGLVDFSFEGEQWLGAIRGLDRLLKETGYYLLMLSPERELLQKAFYIQARAAFITLLLIVCSVPVTWLLARRVAGPMRELASTTQRVGRFDFTGRVSRRSRVKEVAELSGAVEMMQSTIRRFTLLINSLAGEEDFDALLDIITGETLKICQADAVAAYLVDESGTQLTPVTVHDQRQRVDGAGTIGDISLLHSSYMETVLSSGEKMVRQIHIDAPDECTPLLKLLGRKSMRLLLLPLTNRQQEGVGVLCILYRAESDGEETMDEARIAFAEAISGFAAVTLESRKMLKMQKELLASFIRLLAGAIDAKSPYTGGHCQRVPVLTRMLAQKACDEPAGTFAGFSLDAKQWEALHIASWLHDCGKVTTPEYVVDKATKLETLYDRIHEIRMRFEVLKRDATIEYWQGRCDGEDPGRLEATLGRRHRELDEEYAFVAQCNLGGEFMESEDIERLHRIAGRTWERTLDDRIGVSWEEGKRKEASGEQILPATESLLADKPEHLVARSEKYQIHREDDYGFKVETPEHLYNRGEVHNLTIRRGTLTDEERYQINDHIVQTIIMLKKLPYPKHLQEVPDIAGGHHEKIDGTGYPRRLDGEHLSIPAKIMAIADIFEALTASDRPYKKAKPLSEVLNIMVYMARDNHIDADLFRLFLVSGVYGEYADEYLLPEQQDVSDIKAYLEGLEAA